MSSLGMLRRWIAVAAALPFVMVHHDAHIPPPTRLDDLVRAMTHHRVVAARLSPPFVYAPTSASRGIEGSLDDEVRLAAMRAIAAGRQSTSADSIRGAAAGQLVMGKFDAAVALLEKLRSQDPSPEVRNDLAAALLARADEQDDPLSALEALVECDAALEVRPVFAPAMFNRALALHRLGLRDAAAAQWREAAAVDSQPQAAPEALRLARAAETIKPAASWTPDAIGSAAERGDEAELERLVRSFPRDSRAWGESVFPAMWAEAVSAGDRVTAARSLKSARAIGAALERIYGERLLRDAVNAIDRADGERIAQLAHAHLVYRTARFAHRDHKPVEAAAGFRAAARDFESAGSPMALVARYYEGSALYAQLRFAETAAVLGELARSRPAERGYLAFSAQMGWEYGLSLAAQGHLSQAITIFEQSRRTFRALDDVDSAGVMEEFLAAALDEAGDAGEAWRVRRNVLAGAAALQRSRALTDAIASSMQRAEWERARALAAVSVATSRDLDPAMRAQAHLQRAIANASLRRSSDADADLTEADRLTRSVSDAEVRGVLAQLSGVAHATLDADDHPERALEWLRGSIESVRSRGWTTAAAGLYLQRARIHRALSRIAEARGDVAQAIEAFEQERAGVDEPQLRALVLVTAAGLFSEAIALDMQAGDPSRAFEHSEAARARALLEMFDRRANPTMTRAATATGIARSLAGDAAILSYVDLGDRVLVFVLRREGLEAVTLPVSAAAARDSAARCGEAVRDGLRTEILQSCATAYDTLLAPVASRIEGAHHLAVVPSESIRDLPFGALYDRRSGRHLAADVSLTEAPSAMLAVECARRGRSLHDRSGTLVVGASEFDRSRYPRLAPLPYVEREADRVASIYSHSMKLTADAATPERILRELSLHSIIHYAGHALSITQRAGQSRLIVAKGSDERSEITAENIAALSLSGTRAVVLSACSTTAGAGTDGLTNLAAAFVAAGAPEVVGSRWEVDDDRAVTLAADLHAAIAAGDDPATALRQSVSKSSDPIWLTVSVFGGSEHLIAEKRRER